MNKIYMKFIKPDNLTEAEFFAQKKERIAELLAKTAVVGAAIKETKKTYDLLARKVSAEDVEKMKKCADKFSDDSLASSTNAIKNSKGFKDMVDSITDDDTMSAKPSPILSRARCERMLTVKRGFGGKTVVCQRDNHKIK